MKIKRIAITPGEPAGIGADIVIELAQRGWEHEIVACCSPELLLSRAKLLQKTIKLIPYQPLLLAKAQEPGTITISPFQLANDVVCGKLDEGNSSYVIDTLSYAGDRALKGEFDAIVTGPVHKGIINQSGISFSGHTEFFAKQANHDVAMMLATKEMNVALVTTHIPLSSVPKAITSARLTKIITILDKDLKSKFKIKSPVIYVCGLNPHAGEDGHLGREEIDTIIPTLNLLRQKGFNLVGPLPADTIFQPQYLDKADVILTMYHDQGLPVLKSQGFYNIFNITLGLPYIRTSVGHGTALELAGTGKVNSSSMLYALNKAMELLK